MKPTPDTHTHQEESMEVGSFIGHFFKSCIFMFQVQVQLFCQLLLLLINLTTTDMTQFSQQFLKVVQKGSKAVAEGSADIIINRTKEMHVSDSQKIVPYHRFRHCFQSHHPSLAECAHGHEAQSVLLLGHPTMSADHTHKIRLTLQ
jgi:hypothetical protein